MATLVAADVDGTNRVVIDKAMVGASQPSWSPDDRSVAYSRQTGGDFSDRTFLAAADGASPVRQIGDPSLMAWAPSFSPDGKRVAFVSEDQRSSRLMAMNVDGTDIRRLSTGSLDAIGWGMEHGSHGFAWSPDGRRILLSAGTGDINEDEPVTRDLYVLEVDGRTPERPIATDPLLEYGATWSPDGARIAYLRGANGGFPDLVVASADGSQGTVLARDVSWFTPHWSPDGTRVLAVSGRGSGITAFDSDGAATATNVVSRLKGVNDYTPAGMTYYDWQRVVP